MPKNTKKGANKNKKNLKCAARPLFLKKEILGKTLYGEVVKELGMCHFNVFIFEMNKEIVCRICNSIKKTQRVQTNSIVIVGIREFETEKADILYVYLPEEKSALQKIKEIPKKKEEDDYAPEIEFEEFDFNDI